MLLNDLKNDVINRLNDSQLPIDAIYYVMREVMQELEATYNRVLQEENSIKMKEIAEVDNQMGSPAAAAQENEEPEVKVEQVTAAEEKAQDKEEK